MNPDTLGSSDALATTPPPVLTTEADKPVAVQKIPKVLHVIWIGPHNPPQELIDTWDNKHVNNWFFTKWSDHKGWVNQDQINRMREWNGKADLMRLEILYKYGGIVVDADSECLRSLDEGPEDFLSNTGAFAFYENESVRPGIIGCGVMGAPKGSEFFAECIKRAGTKDMSKPAWTTVGPMLITEVAKDMPNAIKVYPAKWVHPLHYTGNKAPGAEGIKPYCEQKWGGTRGYNVLRRRPCWCDECRINMLRCPWG
jgi:glycosyl transferase-like sugar-binding protein